MTEEIIEKYRAIDKESLALALEEEHRRRGFRKEMAIIEPNYLIMAYFLSALSVIAGENEQGVHLSEVVAVMDEVGPTFIPFQIRRSMWEMMIPPEHEDDAFELGLLHFNDDKTLFLTEDGTSLLEKHR